MQKEKRRRRMSEEVGFGEWFGIALVILIFVLAIMGGMLGGIF